MAIYGFGSGLRQNVSSLALKLAMPVPPPRRTIRHRAVSGSCRPADTAYIRAKQKLIKLLEEQKQAIIYRAVTRGLDPTSASSPRVSNGSAMSRSIGRCLGSSLSSTA